MKTTELFRVSSIDVSMQIALKLVGLTKLLRTAEPVTFTTGAALVQYELEEDGNTSASIEKDAGAAEIKYKEIETKIETKLFAPTISATNDAINKGDIETVLTGQTNKVINKTAGEIAQLFVDSVTGATKATKMNGFNDEMRKNLIKVSSKVAEKLDDEGTGQVFVLMNNNDFVELDGFVNTNLTDSVFGFNFYTTQLGVDLVVTPKVKEGTIAAYDAGNMKFAYRDQENAPSTLSSDIEYEDIEGLEYSNMFKVSKPVADPIARKQSVVLEAEVAVYPVFPEAVVIMTLKDRPVTPPEGK